MTHTGVGSMGAPGALIPATQSLFVSTDQMQVIMHTRLSVGTKINNEFSYTQSCKRLSPVLNPFIASMSYNEFTCRATSWVCLPAKGVPTRSSSCNSFFQELNSV